MSYTKLLYHIVFRTKNSKNTILEQHENEIAFIKNQKEHHKTISFEEEFRKFLIENGIYIDERYFLKD